MYCPAAEYYTHRQRKELGLYGKWFSSTLMPLPPLVMN
jgi:hypothetical protein